MPKRINYDEFCKDCGQETEYCICELVVWKYCPECCDRYEVPRERERCYFCQTLLRKDPL